MGAVLRRGLTACRRGSWRKVGFQPVGVMRQYERGGDGQFYDGLLMDLVRDDRSS